MISHPFKKFPRTKSTIFCPILITYNALILGWASLSGSCLGSSHDLAGHRVVGTIVTIFDVLVLQLALLRHLVAVWTFSATGTVALDKEGANMLSVALVVWFCPLQLF